MQIVSESQRVKWYSAVGVCFIFGLVWFGGHPPTRWCEKGTANGFLEVSTTAAGKGLPKVILAYNRKLLKKDSLPVAFEYAGQMLTFTYTNAPTQIHVCQQDTMT